MRFFIVAGGGLGIAGGAMLPDNVTAGVGLAIAAFFLLMTGFRTEQK